MWKIPFIPSEKKWIAENILFIHHQVHIPLLNHVVHFHLNSSSFYRQSSCRHSKSHGKKKCSHINHRLFVSLSLSKPHHFFFSSAPTKECLLHVPRNLPSTFWRAFNSISRNVTIFFFVFLWFPQLRLIMTFPPGTIFLSLSHERSYWNVYGCIRFWNGKGLTFEWCLSSGGDTVVDVNLNSKRTLSIISDFLQFPPTMHSFLPLNFIHPPPFGNFLPLAVQWNLPSVSREEHTVQSFLFTLWNWEIFHTSQRCNASTSPSNSK